MILTKEFLQASDACKEGYRFVLEGGVVGGDYDAAIEYCKTNGQQEYAEWLEQNKNTIASWKAVGISCTKQFGFYCHLTEAFQWFASQQEAIDAIAVAKENYKQEKRNLFPVIFEQINENGDATWTPGAIEVFAEEGDFQVFNQMTGTHTKITGRNAALAKRDEFVDAYCNELPWPLLSNYINENGEMTTDAESVEQSLPR